ncbi:hypothetical protein TWF694_007939 [Orbilia ellipsospora]|uniref:Uncharacterized protein n=1 Tax=Orbilia ellipsospora TaxID=2528407 RepID=A0AAV9XK68_9PEZI
MATPGARSSRPHHPLQYSRSNLGIDVAGLDNRFAGALLSRSHDACLQESRQPTTVAATTDTDRLVAPSDDHHLNNTDSNNSSAASNNSNSNSNTTIARKDSRNTTFASSSSSNSNLFSELDDLPAAVSSTSSNRKSSSSSSKPAHRENPRSLPGSPYSMTDSFDSSSAVSPSPTASSFSSIRLIPYSTSSFLRPGSRFEGTQQSDKQTYTVNVEIKHVDMRESFLCGYLCIQGLTQDNPTLTTYFEGEMIGNKYAFKTKNKSWGANEKIDLQHWGRFPAYRPFSKNSKTKDVHNKEFGEQEHIFMRWKEYFLVPNHRVKELTGASFDGFYYICFSQVTGNVSGIYFHSNSEKWQQLELKHIPDHGLYGSIEFR